MLVVVLVLCTGLVASSAVEKRTTFATGLVSQECLSCICQLESRCTDVGCVMDEGSLSCGYFQIKYNYWLDCGSIGSDWKSCASELQCASQCIQNYMKRYAAHYNCPPTCEGYAREHNGGPRGCHSSSTLNYWHNLQAKPGCHGVH